MLKKTRTSVIYTLILILVSLVLNQTQVFAANITQKQAKDKIIKLKQLENAEQNKLYKNQKKLETTSSNLQASKSLYTTIEGQLNQLEKELVLSTNEFNSLDIQMKNRIRQVFKSQRTGMFELILSTKDFNSLMDMVYYERLIIKRDYRRMIAVKQKAQKIAQMRKDIQSRKKYLASTIQDINSQQKDIQRAIAKNQIMINKLKTDRKYYERTERELARQSDNIQSMLKHKSSDTTIVSSGAFMKPIGGRITSPFGYRTHPIFNSRTFHSGVDIGGPNYGSIVASNSGRVIYSGWYGGYGKVVIVDHGVVNGNPMTTLYAHMSTIKVNQGQTVKKGQVLGLEGSTGYSTGPHCHFEVRINGKPNNPLNYI